MIIFLIFISTSMWVLFDSRNYKDEMKEAGKGESSVAWCFGCLLFWIIVFPYYLIRREKYKEIRRKREKVSTEKMMSVKVSGK